MNKKRPLPPETGFLVDFNAHRVPAALGLNVPPAAAAAMYGVDQAALLAHEATAAEEVSRTARRLLAEPALAEAVDRLPVPPGGTLLTAGDSITIYSYSYAEVLAAMVALRRSQDGIRFVNQAQSGYTSTHGLEQTFTQSLAYQPHLVFINFGVNDNKRFGGEPAGEAGRPEPTLLVSPAAYRANLSAMVRAFKAFSPALPVLLTPTPVIETLVNHNVEFQAMRMTWDNRDLLAAADTVLSIANEEGIPCVDLMSLFGKNPDPALYVADGLHPGPPGHELILRHLLNTVSRWPSHNQA